MMNNNIKIPPKKLDAVCRRHQIQRLSFFGSILRDDFGPESDVDVLIEFKPDAQVGLEFFTIEQELSELFGRNVDLNTYGFLSRYFRDKIKAEAEVFYDAA